MIVNPSPAAGAPAAPCRAVRAALTRLGLEHHVERTRSLEHARAARARGRRGRARWRSPSAATAWSARSPARCAAPTACSASCPGGRGNDFARSLGIPLDPVAACACSRRGRAAARPRRGRRAARSSESPAAASTPRPTGSPTRPGWCAATSSTPTARCARWRAGGRRRSRSTLDGGEPRASPATRVAAANSRRYGGGMLLAPDASLDDGQLDVVIDRRRAAAPLPAPAADRVQGRARPPARRRGGAGADGCESPPRARSRSTPTATRSPSCPVDPRVRCRAAVRATRCRGGSDERARREDRAPPGRSAVARRAGRGGGTSLPGKVLIRLEPDAIGALAARLPDGSAVDLGDQRQDDHGRDGRLDPRARGHRGWSTTAPARTWPAASPRRCSARRAAAARIDGELGLFEVDEFWLDRVAPQLAPRAMLLGNLFRDQLDRYGELETIADRWAALVGGAARATRPGAERRRSR